VGATLAAGAVALSSVLASQPVSALPSPITIQKGRTGPSSITAGSNQTTSFDITVTNTGALPALAVVVDRMDEGLVIDAIESQTHGFHCAQRGGSDTEFLCYKLLLAGRSSATARVTVHAPAATRAGDYTNCAGVGITFNSPWPSSVCDPVLDSGLPEVTAAVTVKNEAELKITSTTSPNGIDPGTNAVVSVGVTNEGPSDATGPVKVMTPLPAGLAFVSGSAPWVCALDASNVVGCTWTDAPPPIEAQAAQQGASTLFPVAATAPPLELTLATARPATVGSYAVTSTASTQTPDSTPADASATSTIQVTPVDLAISKQGSGLFALNRTSSWNLAVSNVGPIEDAATIQVTDTLAPGLEFVSAAGAGWACGNSGQAVTCTRAGLARSAQDVIAITAKVTSGSARFENSATVVTDSYEAVTSNNTASAAAQASPVDLALTKTAVTSPVAVGSTSSWKITVSNVGSIDDRGAITVSDTLPATQTLVSAGGDHFTCTSSAQKLTCTHTDTSFAANISEEILVTAVVSAAGVAENSALVTTTSYEPNTSNNSATATVGFTRLAQTAKPLPKSPTKVKSGRTDQGQKLRTRVMCRPLKRSAAGQASYCKVTRTNRYVRIKVIGDTPMKVKIIQTAKGTTKYKPFVQKKTYIVRP
jgi:uncharacterized repeat protein (TIGR01451 family)